MVVNWSVKDGKWFVVARCIHSGGLESEKFTILETLRLFL